MTVFVQLYESTEEAVKTEVATFLKVFPNGAVFANNIGGQGYDVVLFGQAAPSFSIDVGRMDLRLQSPEYAQVSASLREVGFASVFDLLGTYSGQIGDLSGWLEDAPINRDRNLRLQYLAGMGLNLYRADVIFGNMVAGGVRFPQQLFTGPVAALEELERIVRLRVGPLITQSLNNDPVPFRLSASPISPGLPPTLPRLRNALSSIWERSS